MDAGQKIAYSQTVGLDFKPLASKPYFRLFVMFFAVVFDDRGQGKDGHKHDDPN